MTSANGMPLSLSRFNVSPIPTTAKLSTKRRGAAAKKRSSKLRDYMGICVRDTCTLESEFTVVAHKKNAGPIDEVEIAIKWLHRNHFHHIMAR